MYEFLIMTPNQPSIRCKHSIMAGRKRRTEISLQSKPADSLPEYKGCELTEACWHPMVFPEQVPALLMQMWKSSAPGWCASYAWQE